MVIVTCIKGRPKVLSLLLQNSKVDPSAQNYRALDTRHEEIVKLLLQDRRINHHQLQLSSEQIKEAVNKGLLRQLLSIL